MVGLPWCSCVCLPAEAMGIILNRSFKKKKKTCRGLISSRLERKPLLGLGGGRNTRSTRTLLNGAFPVLLSQPLPREQEPSAVFCMAHCSSASRENHLWWCHCCCWGERRVCTAWADLEKTWLSCIHSPGFCRSLGNHCLLSQFLHEHQALEPLKNQWVSLQTQVMAGGQTWRDVLPLEIDSQMGCHPSILRDLGTVAVAVCGSGFLQPHESTFLQTNEQHFSTSWVNHF